MFKVEDGTGYIDSNSFVTVTFFNDYCSQRGLSLIDPATSSAYTNEKIEQALIRATMFLSESFPWNGQRRYLRWSTEVRDGHEGLQALAFPRYGLYDEEGSYVDDDEIPRELKWATCMLGHHELLDPNSLQPAYLAHDRIKMEQVGPVSVTYETSRLDANSARPVLLGVIDLISQFLRPGAGNRLSGKTIRR